MPGLGGNTKETSGATEISAISKHREALDREVKIEQLRDRREETEKTREETRVLNTKPHRRPRARGRLSWIPRQSSSPSAHPPSEGPGRSNS